MMAGKISNKTFTDEDGAQLWVQRGWFDGRVLFDTDPGTPGVDTLISLTPAQVAELVAFVQGKPA